MKITRRQLRRLIREALLLDDVSDSGVRTDNDDDPAEQTTIQAAGTVIVDRGQNSSDPHILCLVAYGNWGFPKGKVEADETREEAAIRETKEETGLEEGSDWILTGEQAPSITYGKGKKKKTATYFMASRVSEKQPYLPVNPELGHPEHDDWSWVPASQLYDILPMGDEHRQNMGPVIEYIHQTLGVGQ